MRPFRFRAESALELRRKHEDDARLLLTRAQNAAATADDRLAAARRRVAAASAALSSVQTHGAPIWLIDWHRSWILKHSREAAACQMEATVAHGVVAKATDALRIAHRKRRVLERLRDRLKARYVREANRQELAQMNELATMRYLIAHGERKEQQ